MRALLSLAAAFAVAFTVAQAPRPKPVHQPYPKTSVVGSCTTDAECPSDRYCAPRLQGCGLNVAGSVIVGGTCRPNYVVKEGPHSCPAEPAVCAAGCSKLPVHQPGCKGCVCDVCPSVDAGE